MIRYQTLTAIFMIFYCVEFGLKTAIFSILPSSILFFRNSENSLKALAAEADICHCDPCRCHETPTDCRGCSNEIMRLVNNTLDAATSQEQPPEKESPDILEQNPLSLINSLCVTVEKEEEDFGDLPSIPSQFSVNDNYVALTSDSVLEGEGQLITSSTALLNATEPSEPSAEELLQLEENGNDLLAFPTAPLTEAESSPGIAVPVMFNASTGNFECIKTGGPQHSIAKVWRDSQPTVSHGCVCGESKGKSPCCVVVCLKTLKQIKKAVKKGCCILKNTDEQPTVPPDSENVEQSNGNVEAERTEESPSIAVSTSRQDSLLEFVEILDLPNSVFSLDIEEDGDEYQF